MPEGDTIAYAANRIRPVLQGRVPDEIKTPQPRHALDRWPERLAGRTVKQVDTHGKHLFLRFDGGLTLHSHLGMVGTWGVYANGRRWARSHRRAWIILGLDGTDVVEFDGSTLELVTDGRTRYVYKQDHCARCGTPIRRWDLGGRWAYACETCQPVFRQRAARPGDRSQRRPARR